MAIWAEQLCVAASAAEFAEAVGSIYEIWVAVGDPAEEGCGFGGVAGAVVKVG